MIGNIPVLLVSVVFLMMRRLFLSVRLVSAGNLASQVVTASSAVSADTPLRTFADHINDVLIVMPGFAILLNQPNMPLQLWMVRS